MIGARHILASALAVGAAILAATVLQSAPAEARRAGRPLQDRKASRHSIGPWAANAAPPEVNQVFNKQQNRRRRYRPGDADTQPQRAYFWERPGRTTSLPDNPERGR